MTDGQQTTELRAKHAVESIRSQILELNRIFSIVIKAVSTGGIISTSAKGIQEWKAKAVIVVSEQVHPVEGQKLKEILSVHTGDVWSSFVQMVIKFRGFLESLITRLEKHPEQVFAGQDV